MPYDLKMSDILRDQLSEQLSLQWIQSDDSFVWRKFALPVKDISGQFFIADRADQLRLRTNSSGIGASIPMVGAGGGYTPYECEFIPYGSMIPMSMLAANSPFMNKSQGFKICANELNKTVENSLVSNLFTYTNWGAAGVGYYTGTSSSLASTISSDTFMQFDIDGSEPFKVIKLACEIIQKRTGYKPNGALMNFEVYRNLRDHSDLKSQSVYVNGLKVAASDVAEACDLQEVSVCGAVANSALDGGTASYSSLFGKHILLYYKPASLSLFNASAFACPVWVQANGVKDFPGAVEKNPLGIWAWESFNANRAVVEFYNAIHFDCVIVDQSLGFFLKDCIG